jgi:hypothetical protein
VVVGGVISQRTCGGCSFVFEQLQVRFLCTLKIVQLGFKTFILEVGSSVIRLVGSGFTLLVGSDVIPLVGGGNVTSWVALGVGIIGKS